MQYLLDINVKKKYGGVCEAGELALKTERGLLLPAGSSVRYTF